MLQKLGDLIVSGKAGYEPAGSRKTNKPRTGRAEGACRRWRCKLSQLNDDLMASLAHCIGCPSVASYNL